MDKAVEKGLNRLMLTQRTDKMRRDGVPLEAMLLEWTKSVFEWQHAPDDEKLDAAAVMVTGAAGFFVRVSDDVAATFARKEIREQRKRTDNQELTQAEYARDISKATCESAAEIMQERETKKYNGGGDAEFPPSAADVYRDMKHIIVLFTDDETLEFVYDAVRAFEVLQYAWTAARTTGCPEDIFEACERIRLTEKGE